MHMHGTVHAPPVTPLGTCRWDSWILDVAMCNLGGMFAGMWTVRHFGSKKYDWQGLSQQKGVLRKAQCASHHAVILHMSRLEPCACPPLPRSCCTIAACFRYKEQDPRTVCLLSFSPGR